MTEYRWEREGFFRDPPAHRFLRALPDENAQLLDTYLLNDSTVTYASAAAFLEQYQGSPLRDLLFLGIKPSSVQMGVRALSMFAAIGHLSSRDDGADVELLARDYVNDFFRRYETRWSELDRWVFRHNDISSIRWRNANERQMWSFLARHGTESFAPLVGLLLSRDVSRSNRRLLFHNLHNLVFRQEYDSPAYVADCDWVVGALGLEEFMHGAWRQIPYDLNRGVSIRQVFSGNNNRLDPVDVSLPVVLRQLRRGQNDGEADDEEKDISGLIVFGATTDVVATLPEVDTETIRHDFILSWHLTELSLRTSSRGRRVDFSLDCRERQGDENDGSKEITVGLEIREFADDVDDEIGYLAEVRFVPDLDVGDVMRVVQFALNDELSVLYRLENADEETWALFEERDIYGRLAALLERYRYDRSQNHDRSAAVKKLERSRFEFLRRRIKDFGEGLGEFMRIEASS